MKNPFFKNKGPFKIDKLLSLSNIKNLDNFKSDLIKNVNDLINANNNEITFFHSKKYENFAKNSKCWLICKHRRVRVKETKQLSFCKSSKKNPR